MAAGEPQRPADDNGTQRQRARLAAWCRVTGAVLAMATVICLRLNVISIQQAVAIGLLAVLLIVGGLIAGSTVDPATAHRLGFRAGLRVGTLLRRLRSALRRRGPSGRAGPPP